MTTDSVTRPGKRGRLQRLRKFFSHSSTAAELSHPPPASPEAANPIRSKLRSSGLSGTRSSSCRSEKSDLGARPLSPTGQTTSPAQGCPASNPGRDLLGRALQLLEERERVTIQGYLLPSTDDIASALEEAFNAAQEKQKVCESKRWTFTWGKHSMRLWDEADKVMLWLDRFKQVGDIAVNADPIHAGLPWAGIRLLLEATISESRQMAALLTGLKTTLYMMNRLKAYWEYLRELPETQSRTNFETALTELHAIILQFLARAIQIYQKTSLSRGFDAFWKPDEVSNFDSECDKIAARAETEASNCDRTLSAIERGGANQRKEHLQRVLKELEELRDIEESVNMLATRIDLAGLPSVNGAAFNSYDDELDARCHPDTRIDLLRQIRDWADDPQSKCILWLNGMAGTGKSTISRTVAQSFADAGQLGASFFFKRGEGERGNASRFFTTIAVQLGRTVPAMVPYVRKAIDADPGDISSFLKAKFKKIRDNYNDLHPDSSLPQDWPSDQCIQALAEMAVPLFIFAATVSRFVGDHRWSPKRRLADVLKYQISGQASKLDKTYLPVLDHLLANLSDPEQEDLVREFQAVIGSIVVLAEPLGTSSLARLLNIAKETIDCRLDSLHSVLNIPSNPDSPIRLLHLSFREFLLDPYKQGKSPFWVDERERHEVIAARCLELMSERLGENICHLEFPGKPRGDIDRDLQSIIAADGNTEISYFLSDAKRFILQNRWIIDTAPLQLYSSAIIFAPIKSFIRAQFERPIQWIRRLPEVPPAWSLELQKLEGHSGAVNAVAFSHDGQLLASASDDRTIRLWNPVTGEQVQMLKGHTGAVNAVAFSHNGQLLASTSDDRTVRLWNPVTGEQVQMLEGHSSTVRAVAFSHDSQLLASSSYDRTVRLWNPATGEQVQMLEGHSNMASSVAFSHDGQLLASVSDDSTVRLWNPATGEQVQELKGHSNWVNSVAFSHDGRLLASASSDGTVRLWNPVTGEQVRELKGHGDWVNSVVFSHDGRLLASASDDGTVRLWNPVAGEQVQMLEGHSGTVGAVAFSHDGRLLASSSYDRTVRLWNPATGERTQELKGRGDRVRAVAFSHDGRLLASASDDRAVRLWNPAMGEQVRELKGHRDRVRAIAFSHDGQLLASASNDRTVRLWNPVTGEQVQMLEGRSSTVRAVAFSHDGQLLASSSYDRTVRLWNPATGEQAQELKGHSDRVRAIAFSDDGQLLTSASNDETVRLWNPTTGEQVQELKGHSDWVRAVAFSHDDQLLASASDDSTVRLWNPATGEQVQELKGHSDWVRAIAFSHDGQLLASASNDRTVRLWNPTTGGQVQTLKQNVTIYQLHFSTDSQYLESDKGILCHRSHPSTVLSLTPKLAGHIFLNGDWITRDGRNLLWLPYDYRGTCSALRGNLLVIGQSSGLVHFIEFSTLSAII
ncbi:WD40 repeat-like protein [Cenococcum geophilum 1.58]|uniref:WD40 repeat-like protein n=1 Tax=Cenococcum geophilum 1.58 TaxID=794803 RepID=UPI00358FE8F9|nr:WD40 repeat-like protein [Cenococcum geophilum 1.58]